MLAADNVKVPFPVLVNVPDPVAIRSADRIATGSGTLTKTGNGTLTLSAANTYTGATTISDGTLAISNATGLGTTDAAASVVPRPVAFEIAKVPSEIVVAPV